MAKVLEKEPEVFAELNPFLKLTNVK